MTLLRSLSVVAWVALVSAPAAAQVKPKIYILFDTSESMLLTDAHDVYAGPCTPGPGQGCPPGLSCEFAETGDFRCGVTGTRLGDDGSALCPGLGTTTRLYQLKAALIDVLQGMGAEEIDFALATFPQMSDPTREPLCPLACYRDDPSGPCAGHYFTTSETLSEHNPVGEFRFGCKTTQHDPLLPAQQNANCGDPGNPCAPWYSSFTDEVLKVPFGAAIERVMYYVDQREDTDRLAPLVDPEVRSAQSWFTPLGKSLFYAHGYFHRDVVLPADDYRKKCERLTIAFFTDGNETCNQDTDDPFYATTWARSLRDLGVTTHTVAIDTTAALLDDIAQEGGGQPFNVTGTTAELKRAFLEIIARSLPPAESCNGEDDDCDGDIDEDFPLKGQACDNGELGECFATGTYVCKADGTSVECNAPAGTSEPEKCDGKDNNCNGAIDEGLSCAPCVPQPEICNGRDDDCNSIIDDNVDLSDIDCGSTVGECRPGTPKCEDGKLICEEGNAPSPEICDNKDNDCDTVVDHFSEVCYPFNRGCVLETGVCQGQCRIGTRVCKEGDWGDCTGAVGPSSEICDGVDNDCDGVADNQAECPEGSQCIEGRCALPCGVGEFPCPGGFLCRDAFCVRDPCDPAACDRQGGFCHDGECVDPCEGITCPVFETCVRGRCVNNSCYRRGCPEAQRCVQGQCRADPCADVSCGTDAFCSDGQCIRLCSALRCPAGTLCRIVETADGTAAKCAEDACADIACAFGLECVDGQCIIERCKGVRCELGQACVAGKCEVDRCELTSCPDGHRCHDGSCEPAVERTTNLLATGAGGFDCSVGKPPPDAAPPLWIMLMLVSALLRRRGRGQR